jgi:hypothetical protein
MKDGRPFTFAGVWEGWKDPESGEWLRTCTIITGEPNELVAQIHPRMPVILPEQHHAAWLGETDDGNLKELAFTQQSCHRGPFDNRRDLEPIDSEEPDPHAAFAEIAFEVYYPLVSYEHFSSDFLFPPSTPYSQAQLGPGFRSICQ